MYHCIFVNIIVYLYIHMDESFLDYAGIPDFKQAQPSFS